MECDKVRNNNRATSRKLYSQPSSNPEDINRILKLNNKIYYQIIKLNSVGAMDYKELQGVATYLGLPGNLKRKQLMALIVARKKGKEDIVDAILSEVNRERAGKKIVKFMQPPYSPFPPIVSTVPSYIRRPDYPQLQNTSQIYPFDLQVPIFRRTRLNPPIKRPKISIQSAKGHHHIMQSNAGPSNSHQNSRNPPVTIPSTAFEGNTYEMSTDPPNIAIVPTSSSTDDILLTDNSTPFENVSNNDEWMEGVFSSTEYKDELTPANLGPSASNFCSDNEITSNYYEVPMMDVTLLHNMPPEYSNIRTRLHLGTDPICTLTYINTVMPESQETKLLSFYNGSIVVPEEQASIYNGRVCKNHLHNTPFDTLCNVATSIIENTVNNTSSNLSKSGKKIVNCDLDTLSKVALSRLENQDEVDFEFDNILDYILEENDEVGRVVVNQAAGSANMEVTSTIQSPQDEPLDFSVKQTDNFPILRFEKNTQYFAWYNTRTAICSPLKYTGFGCKSTCFVYNTVAAMPGGGSDVCFSRPLHCIAHTYETYTKYTPKACVYMDATNADKFHHHGIHSNNVPSCCLLQPEFSLSYDIPKLYLRSIKPEYPTTNCSSNQLIPNIDNNISRRYNYNSSQVYYNVMLPKENNNYIYPKALSSNNNYLELKPRIRNKPNVVPKSTNMDFEASIQPLSVDEEMLIYNSLEDIENIDLSINETYQQIMASQHNSQCVGTQITCPFLYTECYWYETMPLMPSHIRQMHPEKVVRKSKTEYCINFIQLAALGDRGCKIIQEYNNHMYFISLYAKQLLIHITIQELCESVDQHAEKTRGKLIVKLQNGIKSWAGEVNSMHIPLAQLWTTESSLAMPIVHLHSQPNKNFRLYVEVEH